jgi:DNA polymerase I-like protein with 3'-5' exonuclease and polymerase domains
LAIRKKKAPAFERIASPIEEYWEVPFVMIGDTNWFNTSFETGALDNVTCINVDTDREEVSKVLLYLSGAGMLGIDTETMGDDKRSGLDPWRADSRLLLFQIGTADSTWIVQPEYVLLFRSVIEDPNIIHILQNAVFDYKFLKAKYKIEIANIYDTMIAEQVITAGRSGMRVSLAEICRRYEPYRLISKDQREEFVNFKNRNYKFSWKMLYYAARDINLLFPIRTNQLTTLQHFQLLQTSTLEFQLIPCTAMMELGGVYINQVTLGHAISYWTSEQVRLETAIIELYQAELKGKKKKNLMLIEGIGETLTVGGPAQKIEILKTFGFKVENAQRETIEGIDHDVARLLAEYSGVMKITSTYGDNLLKRVNPINGRLHPEFNQLGMGEIAAGAHRDSIATGRYSSDFQQMPRPNPVYAVVTDNELINKLTKMRETKCQEKYAISLS